MEGVRTITCSDGGWSNKKPSCKGKFYMLSERVKVFLFFFYNQNDTGPSGFRFRFKIFYWFTQFTKHIILTVFTEITSITFH